MARQLFMETLRFMAFAPFGIWPYYMLPASIVILDKMRFLFSPHTAVQGSAGRLHPLDGEQLLHGDEPHPPGLQSVHDL